MSFRNPLNHANQVSINVHSRGIGIHFSFATPYEVDPFYPWHHFTKTVGDLSEGWLNYAYTCDQGFGGHLYKNGLCESHYVPNQGYKAEAPSHLTYIEFYVKTIQSCLDAPFYQKLENWLVTLQKEQLVSDEQLRAFREQISSIQHRQTGQLLCLLRRREKQTHPIAEAISIDTTAMLKVCKTG